MINEIFLPEVITEKEEGNKGRFVIEPLSPGFGHTLGNALRRVLLSSLEGAGIRSVKIKGAPHEFTTLPGVREDVVRILLNLKSIIIKSDSEEPVTIVLSEKGKKIVTAGDFKTPTGVEIINKDQYIASLENKNAELEIEATVIKGRGYLSEEEKEKNFPIGTIVLDTVFSPVVRVGWWVEPTRVGKIINLDKLIIEVETNGTIAPSEALKKASEILKEQFSIIAEGGVKKEEKKAVIEDKKKEKEDFHIEELNLSTRTTNALLQAGLDKVSKITKLSLKELKTIKGLGAGGINEIKKAFKKLGLELEE